MMPKNNDDWTPIEILEALKEKNISINELTKKTNSSVLDVYRLDKLISEALAIPLLEHWPSRYVRDKNSQ